MYLSLYQDQEQANYHQLRKQIKQIDIMNKLRLRIYHLIDEQLLHN